MNPKGERKTTYPFSILGVYTSVLLAGISTIFSLLLLQQQPILLVYYVLFTSIITLVALELKIRFLLKRLEVHENLSESENSAVGWRTLILLFLVMLTAISLPMFLATVLDYRVWFTLITSLISGISISEIFFYLYCKRKRSNNSYAARKQTSLRSKQND